jgi:putative oxygen-independent coproporphyrinogen III oxidase
MLSLYLHIPFCVKKCHYCGFYSTPYSLRDASDFLSCLDLEAGRYKQELADRRIESVYIGGGTPTVLSREKLEMLFGIIGRHFLFPAGTEFTVEANPNSLSVGKLTAMLKHGVTRLSLGVQSFSDAVLKTLGRAHTVQNARDAARIARESGFGNIGVDLIYGVPGQSLAQWRESLESAIALGPQHLSVYSLSLDEGSRFHREAAAGRLVLPREELVTAMYEFALKRLGASGYRRYELSNFSLPGFECRHNVNYWERGEYLGLGPAAWSFFRGTRRSNVADVSEYARRISRGMSVIGAHETVSREAAARETIMLGLRAAKGLDLDCFENEYGADFLNDLLRKSGPLRTAELMRLEEGRLVFTDKGFLLSDAVLARLCV